MIGVREVCPRRCVFDQLVDQCADFVGSEVVVLAENDRNVSRVRSRNKPLVARKSDVVVLPNVFDDFGIGRSGSRFVHVSNRDNSVPLGTEFRCSARVRVLVDEKAEDIC